MYTRKVQQGGRITIPAPLLRLLNLKPGDLVELMFQKGQIILSPHQKPSR